MVTATKKDFTCYTYSEAKTGGGQLLEFTCRPEDVDKVKEFLQTIRSVSIPTSSKTHISHGSYGRYSRFDMIQHKYAGGGGGYIEVLEIKNPPDNRCGVVINEYRGCAGSVFDEFRTLKEAIASFDGSWGSDRTDEMTSHEKGFIRRVACGGLDPWFYAVGDQHLMGDFVFPDVIGEDPVFRLNRKFIVLDRDDLPTIKTCMGMRLIEGQLDYYRNEKKQYRVVYWDDGTVWNEYMHTSTPRPLDDGELWIQEAMDKFRNFLTGKADHFTVDFIDGSKFIGRLKPKDSKSHSTEGNYKVRLTLDGGVVKTGEFHFVPTPEIPTVEDSIRKQVEKAGKKLTSIDAVVKFRGPSDLKWMGVYSPPEHICNPPK